MVWDQKDMWLALLLTNYMPIWIKFIQAKIIPTSKYEQYSVAYFLDFLWRLNKSGDWTAFFCIEYKKGAGYSALLQRLKKWDLD